MDTHSPHSRSCPCHARNARLTPQVASNTIANLNTTNTCGLQGGQVSGMYTAQGIAQAPFMDFSLKPLYLSPAPNGVVHSPSPGPVYGFPCYLLVNTQSDGRPSLPVLQDQAAALVMCMWNKHGWAHAECQFNILCDAKQREQRGWGPQIFAGLDPHTAARVRTSS